MTLSILHHTPPRTDSATTGLSWRTCLREVTFLEDGLPHRGALDEERAYRLLLEILCGLHSPMIGETQVMGQFKAFLSGLSPEHGWVRKVGQRLLTDAGAVRERHLRHLGARSYGSAVRQRLNGIAQVALLGTGKLAAEVLCFAAGDGRAVDLWGRRPESPVELPSGVTYRRLADAATSDLSAQPAAVVVAAPVSSLAVAQLARQYRGLRLLIDLRGELDGGPIDVAVPVVALSDVFNEMQVARRHAEAQCAAAKDDIAARSRQFFLRDDRRPFGWDDLCA